MEFLLTRDPIVNAFQLPHQFPPADDKSDPSPAQTYMRERNAMASTAVDVKEYTDAYVFVADMPGLKSTDIKVTVENENILVLTGERKKEEEADVKVKYLSMERKTGKFMRKFSLPGNADVEHISAGCNDGVLTVKVPKIPPPTPKTININVA